MSQSFKKVTRVITSSFLQRVLQHERKGVDADATRQQRIQ